MTAKAETAGKQTEGRAPQAPRGLFITLEGGEGAGKSIQTGHLKDNLERAGHQVVTTREPGGSPGAEAVRHVLLSGAAESLGSDMEAILFAAARADHIDSVIGPALAAGKTVISDRFIDSTRVYQGGSGKADGALIRHLERIACGKTWPDLTIIIDVDPKEGMRRAHKRRKDEEAPDRFEKDSSELQDARRLAYLEIAEAEPKRCVVVNGNNSEERVAERIWQAVCARFPAGHAGKAIDKTKAQPATKPIKSAPPRSAMQSATHTSMQPAKPPGAAKIAPTKNDKSGTTAITIYRESPPGLKTGDKAK